MTSTLTQISVIAIGYAALVSLVALVLTARRRPRPPWLDSMAWMLEVLMLIRAVAGGGAILAGERPVELSTHVGYLMASVALIPLALESVRDDRGPWSSAVVAVAAVASTVIAVRLVMTR